jgi:hypothetical protein
MYDDHSEIRPFGPHGDWDTSDEISKMAVNQLAFVL